MCILTWVYVLFGIVVTLGPEKLGVESPYCHKSLLDDFQLVTQSQPNISQRVIMMIQWRGGKQCKLL